MFIKHLWGPSGVKFEDAHIENPTWQQVEQAIQRLDGDNLNYVMICPDSQDTECMIAGGQENQYMVAVHTENGWFTLIDASRIHAEETIDIIVNQSATECQPHEVCNLENALKAARTFAEAAMLESSLQWQAS